MNNKPIGIFDSGVGGLTVAHAIKQILPSESIVYFGDTAHLPYGDKSTEAIKFYSKKITEFLLKHNSKVIVIACNTASASAFEHLRKEFGNETIILDVIDPVVEHLRNSPINRIGVIGTKRTINSGTYAAKLNKAIPSATVVSLATPLFAPMIEEGFLFDDISNAIIRSYLSNDTLSGIEALILGCTHYPIIKNQISKIFNFNVEIVDSAKIVSVVLRDILEKNNLLNDGREIANDEFFVSDYTTSFEKIARMFFESQINLSKADIWS